MVCAGTLALFAHDFQSAENARGNNSDALVVCQKHVVRKWSVSAADP